MPNQKDLAKLVESQAAMMAQMQQMVYTLTLQVQEQSKRLGERDRRIEEKDRVYQGLLSKILNFNMTDNLERQESSNLQQARNTRSSAENRGSQSIGLGSSLNVGDQNDHVHISEPTSEIEEEPENFARTSFHTPTYKRPKKNGKCLFQKPEEEKVYPRFDARSEMRTHCLLRQNNLQVTEIVNEESVEDIPGTNQPTRNDEQEIQPVVSDQEVPEGIINRLDADPILDNTYENITNIASPNNSTPLNNTTYANNVNQRINIDNHIEIRHLNIGINRNNRPRPENNGLNNNPVLDKTRDFRLVKEKMGKVHFQHGETYQISDLEECFQIFEEVGSTQACVVKKAKHIRTGKFVALKYINLKIDRQNRYLNEYTWLENDPTLVKSMVAQLKLQENPHANLLSFYGFTLHDKMLVICMELMDLTLARLYQLVHRGKGSFPEELLGVIGVSIVKGLIEFERRKIVHRDIKPQNILLNSQGDVKISDFGVSRVLQNTAGGSTVIGTLCYYPPEMTANEQDRFDIRTDVWGMGVTMAEICLGRPVFQGITSTNLFDVFAHIKYFKYDDNLEKELLYAGATLRIANFIRECMRSVDERPMPIDLAKTPFYDIFERITESKRIVQKYVRKITNPPTENHTNSFASNGYPENQNSNYLRNRQPPNSYTNQPSNSYTSQTPNSCTTQPLNSYTSQPSNSYANQLSNSSAVSNEIVVQDPWTVERSRRWLEYQPHLNVVPFGNQYIQKFQRNGISQIYQLAGRVLLYNKKYTVDEFVDMGIARDDACLLYHYLEKMCQHCNLWIIEKIRGIGSVYTNGLKENFKDKNKYREDRYVLSMAVGQYMVLGKNYLEMKYFLAGCCRVNNKSDPIINSLIDLADNLDRFIHHQQNKQQNTQQRLNNGL